MGILRFFVIAVIIFLVIIVLSALAGTLKTILWIFVLVGLPVTLLMWLGDRSVD